MIYTTEGLKNNPVSWNKFSEKEILQYAVGGLLYMPGTNTKIAEEIINKKYADVKAITLCLEDSIGDNMVKIAEQSIKKICDTLHSSILDNVITYDDLPLVFIRVREQGQMTRLFELIGESFNIVAGFNIPKFDCQNCDDYIREFLSIKENVNFPLYIMPIIENKNAMYKETRTDNLLKVNDKLLEISSNVLNVRVGGTDFCHIYGVRRSISNTIYDINVVKDCLIDIINVFNRNFVVSGPVWEYFGTDIDETWAVGLKRELELDLLNGFIGKTAIHPSQLPLIQESLIVTEEQYKDAIDILSVPDGVVGVKKSNGRTKMNEVKTHFNWAKKIICLANIYGVR